jgi:hypothetical protein
LVAENYLKNTPVQAITISGYAETHIIFAPALNCGSPRRFDVAAATTMTHKIIQQLGTFPLLLGEGRGEGEHQTN